jgi:Zn-dependent peptidase ImmA (M78 family)
MPSVPQLEQQPKPTNHTKQIIYDFAEKAADFLNLAPGGDLEFVVQSLGGRIHYQDLPEWNNTDSGSMYVHGPNDFDIYISRFTGPLRDRFTIAHELGHYFLHSQQGKIPAQFERFRVTEENSSPRLEWEANWFAAGFLMPERAFKIAYNINSSNQHLAGVFLVSEQAIHYRKEYLCLE